jgi:hypothetical protein
MTRFALTLCLITSLAGTVQANLVPDTEPLTVTIQREPVDTVEPIYRAYMSVRNDKFAFLVPDNFRLAGDPAHGRFQLENTAAGSLITFTFLHSPGSDSAETGRAVYKEMLASRYVNGKFLGEFTRPAGGNTGLGFEVQWASAAGLVQSTRAVYLPTVAGLLEVTITTSVKDAKTGEANLDEVLRSFAASINGKLIVHHVAAAN